MTNQQIEDFANRGFFYAEEATPKSMVADLLAAVRRVKQKVRDKEVEIYTHRTDSEEPWAIRGLFAPEFEEPIFSEYLMCKEIRQTVHHFLGDQLKLGTVLIFTNPHDQDYGFGWHRDFGKLPRDADEEEELEKAKQGTRQQIAFYGSTPAYRGVLECHGWGEMQTELNALSKEGKWVEMGSLVDDEILDTFAVVGEPEQIADGLKSRFGDIVQRLSFYAPYRSDAERWRKVFADLKAA